MPYPTLEQVLEVIEKRRIRILQDPRDPSWTEHFAELQNEMRDLWKSHLTPDAGDGELPCPACGGEVGHRINCPHGIAFSNVPRT
jgi:hypothetical protein